MLLLNGCLGAPNHASVQLRRQNQQLGLQVAQLKTQHEQDQAIIAGLRQRSPQLATLNQAELDRLFTVHSIKIGRLSGEQDNGLKVYITPLDESGQALKAAGAITIEAFDLAAKEPRLGRWSLTTEQTRALWYGEFLIDYYYAIQVPWQTPPQHKEVTVKVTFVDELTKVPFSAQKQVQVEVNAATAPSTQPASGNR